MALRVATFAMSNRLLEAALTVQARTSQLQLQEASGLVSSDYGGLGGKAKGVINLETSVARVQSYMDAATTADNRINVMYDAAGSIVDLLSSMRAQLTSVMGSLEDGGGSLMTSASEMLSELGSLLNTQYEGRYLFSGSRTDTPAVDVSDATYAAATSPSVADTGYYQGDGSIAGARISDEQVLQYGVTADNPAFEKSLRALNLLKSMSASPVDSSVLEEAQSLIVEAIDGVLAIQANLSLDAGTAERAISKHQTYVDDLSSLVSNVRDVDVAAVAAKVSTYETQLQASYAALGKIQQLCLLNYL